MAPLTPERWDDFVELFCRPGPRGGNGLASNGCWCMWWRGRSRSADQNRAAMQELVMCEEIPGLLAYAEGVVVGWVSVARRESYAGLMRSRTYRPADDDSDVWSITCVFVHPSDRHRGIAERLVEHAVAYARERGAWRLEAYPMAPGRRPDYMGSHSCYTRLGFGAVRQAGPRTVVGRTFT